MGKTRCWELLCGLVPPGAVIEDVFVGVHWTVVRTNLGYGVASTVVGSLLAGEDDRVPFCGGLVGLRVSEFLDMTGADNLTARSVAMALLNASCQPDVVREQDGNARDLLLKKAAAGARIGMVGHFPMVDRLREAGARLDVFELPGRLRPGDLPVEAQASLLPLADVVAITSSAVINGTLEELLAMARPGALRILMGPSTPLRSELFSLGLDVLCGSLVLDGPAALRCASQGASTSQMQGLRKVIAARGEGLV